MELIIAETEILLLLKAIEDGTVTLTSVHEPQRIYAGNVEYHCSNGWKIVVFNDCNQWDYIDCIESSDGRFVEFDTIDIHMPEVREYRPSDEVAWERYGIPGYMKLRDERWPGTVQ